jgi:hypothetical protein
MSYNKTSNEQSIVQIMWQENFRSRRDGNICAGGDVCFHCTDCTLLAFVINPMFSTPCYVQSVHRRANTTARKGINHV